MSALPLLRPPATHVALVADDDDDERALLAIVLRRVGFRVYEARDGAEVVSLAEAQRSAVQLIVSDIGMPVVDGIDATVAIRLIAPQAAVILVTAFADESTLRRASLSGARRVLLKPLDMAYLATAALEMTARP